MCLLLQDIERNVPVTDIRKWNVMDATWSVAVACFTKCGFGIEDAVGIEADD
jgi:hypothetical protein